MLSRAILFSGACEIYGDKKNENGENYQRTKRVHAELHLVSRLVVDVEGKSLEIGGTVLDAVSQDFGVEEFRSLEEVTVSVMTQHFLPWMGRVVEDRMG